MFTIWCTETNTRIQCPSDPQLIKVWDMSAGEWVQLKEYMRYCSYIWTKGLDWETLYPKNRNVKQ